MHRVFAIDVLLCPSEGGGMKTVAEITDRRVAQQRLEHVGYPSDAPEPRPARGPPASVGPFRWLDHEPRATGQRRTSSRARGQTRRACAARDRAGGRACGLKSEESEASDA